MNILILGGGGREHAIARVLKNNQTNLESAHKIFLSPGNGGTGVEFVNVSLSLIPPYDEVKKFCLEQSIDLVVVGPEQYLCDGVVNSLSESPELSSLFVFGPTLEAAQLESSKVFAKEVMSVAGVPTAGYNLLESFSQAEEMVRGRVCDYVLKADGLCAGKGVVLPETEVESLAALKDFFVDKKFGDAAKKVVMEEKLFGQEVSILGFCDGKDVELLPPSQDHKRVHDGDKGPNTGGMGGYAPVKFLTEVDLVKIKTTIFKPILKEMKARGMEFKGILYAGLIVDEVGNIKVIEFNVRFGDPECQCVLPLLKSNLADLFVACANGSINSVSFETTSRPACTVIMASGGYPNSYEVGKVISGLDEIKREVENGLEVFHAGTKSDGGGVVTSGGRVLAVSAFSETRHKGEAEDLQAVIDRCYREVKKINFDGAFYRTDIGQKGL